MCAEHAFDQSAAASVLGLLRSTHLTNNTRDWLTAEATAAARLILRCKYAARTARCDPAFKN